MRHEDLLEKLKEVTDILRERKVNAWVPSDVFRVFDPLEQPAVVEHHD